MEQLLIVFEMIQFGKHNRTSALVENTQFTFAIVIDTYKMKIDA